MKQITLLIGIMLALMLCITPVAAVSADDFEVVTWKDEDGTIMSYMYYNMKSPDEEYIKITTKGTGYLCSLVTFKAANIEGAPVMVVYTSSNKGVKFKAPVYIYLPRSVDEWEIKYYSAFGEYPSTDNKYLKNAGVVNLNKVFGEYIEKGLYLELGSNQEFSSVMRPLHYWAIPDVD